MIKSFRSLWCIDRCKGFGTPESQHTQADPCVARLRPSLAADGCNSGVPKPLQRSIPMKMAEINHDSFMGLLFW